MSLAYYLAPWQTVTTPHGPAQASRVLTYARPQTSTIKSNGVKNFCLTGIEAEAAIHAAIVADPAIIRLPFGPADLGRRWDSLLTTDRAALGAALDNRRIPTDWITNATTPREVVKQIIRTLLACQRLGIWYPETSLDTRWNQLPKAMQDAISAELVRGGLSVIDITQTTPIRSIVRRFALYAEVVKWLEVDASISSTFTQADGNPTNFTEDAGDWIVTSNTLRQQTILAVYYKCRWSGASLDSNNYDVELDGRSGGTGGNAIGPFGRGAVSATVTYYGFPSFEGDANYIVEITVGGEGILATGTAPPAATTNFRLRMNGTSLTGFENDISDATATDATLASGAVGIMSYNAVNTAANNADNFAASDLAVSGDTGSGISPASAQGQDANIFNEIGSASA